MCLGVVCNAVMCILLYNMAIFVYLKSVMIQSIPPLRFALYFSFFSLKLIYIGYSHPIVSKLVRLVAFAENFVNIMASVAGFFDMP